MYVLVNSKTIYFKLVELKLGRVPCQILFYTLYSTSLQIPSDNPLCSSCSLLEAICQQRVRHLDALYSPLTGD